MLSRETIERGVPGQGGLGLSDVVRLVVQVVAQEMYLEKYKNLRRKRDYQSDANSRCQDVLTILQILAVANGGPWPSVCTQQIELLQKGFRSVKVRIWTKKPACVGLCYVSAHTWT